MYIYIHFRGINDDCYTEMFRGMEIQKYDGPIWVGARDTQWLRNYD